MPNSRWAIKPRLLGFVIDALGVSGPPKKPRVPEGPSIVVLPLVNASDDPQQEYLSVGVTEDLTSALAGCSRHVFVISTETAFSYSQARPTWRELGTELGVRYVLQGSVERVGSRIRVVAELVDAETNRTLWRDEYERELLDVQELQAEIVESILVAVGFEIESAELNRLATKSPTTIGAIEALWRGYYHLRQLRRDDLMKARQLFDRALELEPDLASAYGMLAGTYTQEHSQGWTFDPTHLERAERLAWRGLELDEASGVCHAILGVVELVRGNWRETVRHEDRAIELEPSVTWPHALRGMALAQGGQLLEATRSIRRALRLDPHPPHGLLMALAYINYGAGRREEAIDLLETVRAENADSIIARVALAAFHQREGNPEVARDIAQEILAINPGMTIERGMELIPALEKITPSHEFARYADDLRAAGLSSATATTG